jgi:CelD/BcsL family acetyltransferase involved in cellulose biosynthesis
VAEFEIDGQFGLFAYERHKPWQATPISGHFSDRQDILIPSNLSLDLRELLASCRLSKFQFDHLPVGMAEIQTIQHLTDPAYVVSMADGFSSYWERMQLSHRGWCQQLERKKRKLSREVGPLRFELHTDSATVLEALIEWKRGQIVAAGLKDVFGSAMSKALLCETIKEQSHDFSGWLSALYAGDQLIAILLGQRSQHVLNAWIPTHHPQFSNYSPGALLHLELLRRCADEAVTVIDLGRGENPLKMRLANDSQLMAIGSLHRDPWRQHLAAYASQTKNWLVNVSSAQKWVRLYRYYRYSRSRHNSTNREGTH